MTLSESLVKRATHALGYLTGRHTKAAKEAYKGTVQARKAAMKKARDMAKQAKKGKTTKRKAGAAKGQATKIRKTTAAAADEVRRVKKVTRRARVGTGAAAVGVAGAGYGAKRYREKQWENKYNRMRMAQQHALRMSSPERMSIGESIISRLHDVN